MLDEALFDQLDLTEGAVIFDGAMDQLRNETLQIPPLKIPLNGYSTA